MADFCRDCSIAMFGRDFRDMAQLMKPEGYSNEPGKETGALVLCECCGPIIVDINGRRLDNQPYHPSCSCQEFTKRYGVSASVALKHGTTSVEEIANLMEERGLNKDEPK